jgi:osmoprotectant transport system permease protein
VLLALVLAFWARADVAASPPNDGGGGDEADGEISIGSKNFTENRLLAEIMAQLIEAHTDLRVERKGNLGGTTVVFSALRDGQIDIYPEYTGTGWTVHLGHSERITDSLQTFLYVERESLERFGLVWLDPFGFSNSYALAMPEETAERLDIETISDLRAHEDELVAGVSHEFLSRPDGYVGLSAHYDLELSKLRGMEHGLAYQALRERKIDVIDTWTTDAKLLRYRVRVLDDDEGFFPPYDAAPVARTTTLRAHPELRPLLARLGFSIDTRRMQRLNFAIEEDKRSFEDVASEFLREEGLLEQGAPVEAATGREGGFASFLWSRRDETLSLGLEHLVLTGVAVGFAVAFAVPLGIALTFWTRLASPVLAVTGVIQTIPSLALLAFMIPIPGLGLGARSAVAALFLYALLPIVRNTYTGIEEVDADLLEAGRGMGLTRAQILFLVQLPLATRTIMAGVRTSTIISIGIATLAAFIGAGGLGDPIVTGLQLNDTWLILAGAIPAALFALLADFLLGRLEAWLAPGGLD